MSPKVKVILLLKKTCEFDRTNLKMSIDRLRWCLMTCYPFSVILCHLTDKRRKGAKEVLER